MIEKGSREWLEKRAFCGICGQRPCLIHGNTAYHTESVECHLRWLKKTLDVKLHDECEKSKQDYLDDHAPADVILEQIKFNIDSIIDEVFSVEAPSGKNDY
jgi:hypothetical protein